MHAVLHDLHLIVSALLRGSTSMAQRLPGATICLPGCRHRRCDCCKHLLGMGLIKVHLHGAVLANVSL